jgi:hypothetical protein
LVIGIDFTCMYGTLFSKLTHNKRGCRDRGFTT